MRRSLRSNQVNAGQVTQASWFRIAVGGGALAVVGVVGACGARTGLPICAPPFTCAGGSESEGAGRKASGAGGGSATGGGSVGGHQVSDAITCTCECLNEDITFFAPVPSCLPDELNPQVTTPIVLPPGEIYDTALDQFCTYSVGVFLDTLVIDSFPPNTPPEQIISCVCVGDTTIPESSDATDHLKFNASCARTCEETPVCQLGPGGNCSDPVVGQTVDLNACRCTEAEASGQADPVCAPTPGSGDPPVDTHGILASLLSARTDLAMNGALTLSVAIGGDGAVTTALVSGGAELWGETQPDGTASLLFDVDAVVADIHMSVGGSPIDLTEIRASGGAGETPIAFSAAGDGVIPKGVLDLTFVFNQNGVLSTLTVVNPDPIPVFFDRTKGALLIAPISIDNGQGVTALVSLDATVVSSPPKARAGGDHTVSCSALGGAQVTLDGSQSSDPDDDIFHYVWHTGTSFLSEAVVSNTPVATVFAPLGTTSYTLSVLDTHLRISRDTVAVSVVVDAPPTLTLSPPSPACLWAPDHKLVLFELGKDLPFQVADTCDAAPAVTVGSRSIGTDRFIRTIHGLDSILKEEVGAPPVATGV